MDEEEERAGGTEGPGEGRQRDGSGQPGENGRKKVVSSETCSQKLQPHIWTLGWRGWEPLWEVTVPELGMLAVSSDIPRPPLPCGRDRWMPKRLFMTCVPRHGDLRGSEL